MNEITARDIYLGVELLSEEDVRGVLREILNMLREDTFVYPTPQKIYLPYRLWKVLKSHEKNYP